MTKEGNSIIFLLWQEIWRQYYINAFYTMTGDSTWPFRTYLNASISQFHPENIAAIYKLIFKWPHANSIFFLAMFFRQSQGVSLFSWGPGLQTLGNPCLHQHCRARRRDNLTFSRAAVTPLELNWFAWLSLQPHPLVPPVIQVASSEWLSASNSAASGAFQVKWDQPTQASMGCLLCGRVRVVLA